MPAIREDRVMRFALGRYEPIFAPMDGIHGNPQGIDRIKAERERVDPFETAGFESRAHREKQVEVRLFRDPEHQAG